MISSEVLAYGTAISECGKQSTKRGEETECVLELIIALTKFALIILQKISSSYVENTNQRDSCDAACILIPHVLFVFQLYKTVRVMEFAIALIEIFNKHM